MEEEDALLKISFFHTLIALSMCGSTHLSDATFRELTRLHGARHAAPIICRRKDDQNL